MTLNETETALDYQSFVTAGAAELDKHDPNWHDRIDLETLDVGSIYSCVVAQVFGGGDEDDFMIDSPWAIGMDAMGLYRDRDAAREYGFDGDTFDYLQLQPLWESLIIERQNG